MRATESARSENARNFYRLFNESGYSRINGVNRFHSGSSIALIRAAKVSAQPVLHSIWNQISIVSMSTAFSRAISSRRAGKFFKILDRVLGLGMMAGSGRELAIAHSPQLPA